MNQALLSSTINGKAIDGALSCGYTPVDLDTFAMDNGGTQKELVGRTYAGVDGYCPFAVYLGSLFERHYGQLSTGQLRGA